MNHEGEAKKYRSTEGTRSAAERTIAESRRNGRIRALEAQEVKARENKTPKLTQADKLEQGSRE